MTMTMMIFGLPFFVHVSLSWLLLCSSAVPIRSSAFCVVDSSQKEPTKELVKRDEKVCKVLDRRRR